MGMSGDLELAVAHGSTQVRIGTALFGPRPPELTRTPRSNGAAQSVRHRIVLTKSRGTDSCQPDPADQPVRLTQSQVVVAGLSTWKR